MTIKPLLLFFRQLAIFAIITSLAACSGDNSEAPKELTSSPSSVNTTSVYTPQYGKKLINTTAPDFSVESLKGGKIALSQFAGKPVLVNFWATWCPPCIAEIPEFVEVYHELSDKGFSIVGIALDQKDLVAKFVDEYKVDYPIAYGDDDVSILGGEYGNNMGALPYNVILDREHKIVYAEPGPLPKDRLVSILEKLL